jgi:hypothetical protein
MYEIYYMLTAFGVSHRRPCDCGRVVSESQRQDPTLLPRKELNPSRKRKASRLGGSVEAYN